MDKPIVNISPEAWHKMLAYSKTTYDLYSTEVGGMAEAYLQNDQWVIKNPVILKQKVTGTNTHIDREDLALYLSKTLSQNEEVRESSEKGEFLFLWWHTHPNFTASMSGTDWNTINEYTENGNGLALVINNKGDYELIFSIKQPVEAQIECELNILYDSDFDVKAEVEEKCEKDTTLVSGRHYNYRRNWVSGNVGKDSWSNSHQISLLKDVEDEYDEDIKAWNDGFKTGKLDVDVDEDGGYFTETDDDDVFSNKLDQATYAIDAALQKFENGELIPDEVITVIEKLNGTLEKDGVSFMIPKPDEVDRIATAAELIEADDLDNGIKTEINGIAL